MAGSGNALWPAIALAASVLLGVLTAGEPAIDASTSAGNDDRSLPGAPERDVRPALQRIAELQPWGEVVRQQQNDEDETDDEAESADAAVPGSLPGVDWRLVGIVERPQRRYAVLRLGDGALERFEQGAELPGNAALVAVRADAIDVRTGDGIREVRVYPLAAEPSGDASE